LHSCLGLDNAEVLFGSVSSEENSKLAKLRFRGSSKILTTLITIN
jgi:hypothetical protein